MIKKIFLIGFPIFFIATIIMQIFFLLKGLPYVPIFLCVSIFNLPLAFTWGWCFGEYYYNKRNPTND